MIIIDYSGIAMASLFSQVGRAKEVEEGLIRHMILNTLLSYNQKFGKEYGDRVVIACDSRSWRKDYFPEYKACRKTSRESSGINWEKYYDIINLVQGEIQENLPYQVIKLSGMEADDIIGTLALKYATPLQKAMIISSDHDFIQLQQNKNVRQFSPLTKKLVSDSSPAKYLLEHIFRGDTGDGIPNILSDDRVFIEKRRQTPVSQKRIDEWIANIDKLETIMPADVFRNYSRNRKLIALDQISSENKARVISALETVQIAPQSRVLNYLIAKKCAGLIPHTSGFFVASAAPVTTEFSIY